MIQAALGSQSTRLGTHSCRREAFRADDSSARPCRGTQGLQLCCAQSAAAAEAVVKSGRPSERRGSSQREKECRSEMKADWKLDTRPTQTLRQKVTQGLEWSRRASGAVTARTWLSRCPMGTKKDGASFYPDAHSASLQTFKRYQCKV